MKVLADLAFLGGVGLIALAIYQISPTAAIAFAGATLIAFGLLVHPPRKGR